MTALGEAVGNHRFSQSLWKSWHCSQLEMEHIPRADICPTEKFVSKRDKETSNPGSLNPKNHQKMKCENHPREFMQNLEFSPRFIGGQKSGGSGRSGETLIPKHPSGTWEC